MKNMRIIILLLFILAPFMGLEAQEKNDAYKYDKKTYFQIEHDSFKVYYVEECTPDVGNDCTEAAGAFRTDVTKPITMIIDAILKK